MFNKIIKTDKNNDLIDGIIHICNDTEYINKLIDCSFLNDAQVIRSVRSFSVPSFESGAIKIVEKALKCARNVKFVPSGLSQLAVMDEDEKEIKVYAREKNSNVRKASIFHETIRYMHSIYEHKEYEFNLSDAFRELPNDTSSGYPLYTKKSSESAIKESVRSIKSIVNTTNLVDKLSIIMNHPVTIFHRYSPKLKIRNGICNPNFKIRQILGVPFTILLLERVIYNSFSNSFKESFKKYHTIGLRKMEISDRVSKIRSTAIKNKKVVLSGDISGCDKSVTMTHSLNFFEFVSQYITSNTEIFKCLVVYFCRTPMVYSKGMRLSHGSTVTGSWITSIFTTWIVMSAVFYSYKVMYGRFPDDNEIQVQGDDFILVLDDQNDLILFKELMSEFNLSIRRDKCIISTGYQEIEFLGYIWDSNGEPDQTDEWIMGKIIYPERFIKVFGPYRIIYRIMSIIINSKRFNLLFKNFKRFDKHLDALSLRKRPHIRLFNRSGKSVDAVLPLNDMLKYGWRLL